MPKTLRWTKIIDAKSALNEVGYLDTAAARADLIKLLVVFSAGTSAGAIQLEESADPQFTGTWATLGSPVAWAAANRAHSLVINEPMQFGRARISTAVVGGTVDVWALITG